MIFLLFFILACITAIIVYYTAMLLTIFTAAPFVPSIRGAVRVMLDAAHIKPGEIVYDLGSGDGRLVREAARIGATAIGIERSRVLVLWSRTINVIARHAAAGRKISRECALRARFVCGNFYNADLRDADVVFTYLLPQVMARLQPKFEKELRPGTRVVSYAFKVPGWIVVRRIKFSPKSPAVYVYIR